MTDELVEGHWRWVDDNSPVTYFGELIFLDFYCIKGGIPTFVGEILFYK